MVAVARGLMAKPRLLLLDEPSLGLAPVIVQEVFRIISQIRRNTTVLLVEQNARMGFRSPTVAMCWKPDASCSAASPTSCGATKQFAPPISADTPKSSA